MKSTLKHFALMMLLLAAASCKNAENNQDAEATEVFPDSMATPIDTTATTTTVETRTDTMSTTNEKMP